MGALDLRVVCWLDIFQHRNLIVLSIRSLIYFDSGFNFQEMACIVVCFSVLFEMMEECRDEPNRSCGNSLKGVQGLDFVSELLEHH